MNATNIPSESSVSNTCANCRFLQYRTLHGGYCQRYPRQVVIGQFDERHHLWPSMSNGDWCGEHAL